MPPGTQEERHFHNKADQFFFVLSGKATLEVGDVTHQLGEQQGFFVPAGSPHQMKNLSDLPLHFTVTSTPPSHGDRIICTP